MLNFFFELSCDQLCNTRLFNISFGLDKKLLTRNTLFLQCLKIMFLNESNIAFLVSKMAYFFFVSMCHMNQESTFSTYHIECKKYFNRFLCLVHAIWFSQQLNSIYTWPIILNRTFYFVKYDLILK